MLEHVCASYTIFLSMGSSIYKMTQAALVSAEKTMAGMFFNVKESFQLIQLLPKYIFKK